MLNDATGFKRAFIKVGYTDLRRGIDGLAAMIQQEFQMDPFEEGTMFIFCGPLVVKVVVSNCPFNCCNKSVSQSFAQRRIYSLPLAG